MISQGETKMGWWSLLFWVPIGIGLALWAWVEIEIYLAKRGK